MGGDARVVMHGGDAYQIRPFFDTGESLCTNSTLCSGLVLDDLTKKQRKKKAASYERGIQGKAAPFRPSASSALVPRQPRSATECDQTVFIHYSLTLLFNLSFAHTFQPELKEVF